MSGCCCSPSDGRCSRRCVYVEVACYVTTVKSGSGVNARTSVSRSQQGRKALDSYTAVLRQLLDSASTKRDQPALTRHGRPLSSCSIPVLLTGAGPL
jgi:hypothetical protein